MSKKIVAMLLALSMVLGVTACGAKETETPAEKPAAVEEVAEEAPAEEAETAAADGELSYDFTVGYSVLGENTNFFVTVGNSLQEACDSKGTELFRTIDDRDASKMKTAIDTFVMQGADIIVDFTVLENSRETVEGAVSTAQTNLASAMSVLEALQQAPATPGTDSPEIVAARAALTSAESVLAEKSSALETAETEKNSANATLTSAQSELEEIERYL